MAESEQIVLAVSVDPHAALQAELTWHRVEDGEPVVTAELYAHHPRQWLTTGYDLDVPDMPPATAATQPFCGLAVLDDGDCCALVFGILRQWPVEFEVTEPSGDVIDVRASAEGYVLQWVPPTSTLRAKS